MGGEGSTDGAHGCVGRTMVRCSVDMDYFPFFFGADFFAAGFLVAFFVVAAALADAFFGAVRGEALALDFALAAAFVSFEAFSGFAARLATGADSFSATGVSVLCVCNHS